MNEKPVLLFALLLLPTHAPPPPPPPPQHVKFANDSFAQLRDRAVSTIRARVDPKFEERSVMSTLLGGDESKMQAFRCGEWGWW